MMSQNSNPLSRDAQDRNNRPALSSKLGLIVNPVAGLGGRVGLKGSDGVETQQRALELGAVPQALDRTIQALQQLRPLHRLQLITYPEEMGEQAARVCGFAPTVIGTIASGATTPADTVQAAREMLALQAQLLLFAGGDGTARDIYNAVGTAVPVLGIPAGVKIHSAVFATSPRNAGNLARAYLEGQVSSLREAEVMDIDEQAIRQGVVSAKLYGYLQIPFQRRWVQSLKAASDPGEQSAVAAIASDIVDRMLPDCLYIIGPGTTTRAITSQLGLAKTLIGVDVVRNKGLVAADVNEAQLLDLLQRSSAGHGSPAASIIVTPIGGQGYIFGRGNQQLSHRVIETVGLDNIIVVSTAAKIYSLGGRPLLVDTGDPELDEKLTGYISIVTGHNEEMIYRVSR
jgi:predicted polyphosphate/ATP-dependent NAD kinase